MNKLYTTKEQHGTQSAYIYRIISENGNGTVTVMPTTTKKDNKPVTGLRRAELTMNIHMSELDEVVTTYTVEHKLCDAHPASQVPEAIWSAVFSFNAKNENEAQSKAYGWARYHSFSRNDVRIRPATEHEAAYWLHNEWVD